jgi:hypothetical protein
MALVSSKMVRRRMTWVVVGGVSALLVAAAVDAFRPSGSNTSVSKATVSQERSGGEGATGYAPVIAPEAAEAARVGRCSAQQIALRVETLGDSPALVLAHVWGSPCRTPRLPIDVALFSRGGKRADAAVFAPSAFAPTSLAPNLDVVAGFGFVYLCGHPRPVRVVAEAGPYPARGRLPRVYRACVDDLGLYRR